MAAKALSVFNGQETLNSLQQTAQHEITMLYAWGHTMSISYYNLHKDNLNEDVMKTMTQYRITMDSIIGIINKSWTRNLMKQ